MGRLANVAVSGVLVLGLVVGGCGSSGSSSSPSTQTESKSQTSSTGQSGTSAATTTAAGAQTATSASPKQSAGSSAAGSGHGRENTIKLSSPAFTVGGAIPVRYTCDGAGTSPPLRWTAIPTGTTELVLFISDAEGTAPGGGELISWAVAGLKPTLGGVAAGTLPAGAIVGRNSFGKTGYTLCPPRGSQVQHYLVVLYALRHPISAQPGFAADTFSKEAAQAAEDEGLTGFSYKRK